MNVWPSPPHVSSNEHFKSSKKIQIYDVIKYEYQV